MKRLKFFWEDMKDFLKALVNDSWGHFLFWSWNVIFLVFMSLGFAPMVLPEIIRSVRAGEIPSAYLIYVLTLTGIPVAASLIGRKWLKEHPRKLLALGYGVEGPLMILMILRAFLVRDATAVINWITIMAVAGMAVYLWQLLDFKVDERRVALQYLRGAGLTLVMLLGAYVALFVLFYAVPVVLKTPLLLGDLGRSLWGILTNPDEWYTLIMIPYVIMGSILIFYTATLLVGLPVAVPLLYFRAWRSGWRALVSRHGRLPAIGLTAGVAVLCTGVFLLANRQPQARAYALLKDPPASAEQAKTLANEETALRDGLLNAYLAPLRYLSAVGDVGHIRELYKWSLGLTDAQAAGVEALYALLARPLLYEPMEPDKSVYEDYWRRTHQGALNYDSTAAAKLYEAYFDQNILEGERDTLVKAAQSTWSGEQALASLRVVEEHEVHLNRQEVTVVEHGDWAEVELYEVYQNDTYNRQEVVYYFNLPETAVLTGLWLNNSDSRDDRFVYHVAPRGAAQQVYQEQKRVNRDPALLEQIGPRQYRLRVFPVEPAGSIFGPNGGIRNQPLYLWMTFNVFADDGYWPLPSLAEHYNVYWDKQTVRLVNGQPMQNNGDHWLPAQLPVGGLATPVAHRVDFPSGETVILRPVEAAFLPQLPTGVQLGVVLDRSRSMVSQEYTVRSALSEIQRLSPDAEICLTASPYLGEMPARLRLDALATADLFYAGGQKASELLRQYFQQCGGNHYDALLVLTDSGNFTLEKLSAPLPHLNIPVWVVHLDGKFPLGYDDATLEVIQASGGGVASSLEDALQRLSVTLQGQAVAPSSADGGTIADVLDGYEVVTYFAGADAPDGMEVSQHALDDPFAAFAARRLILATMYRQRSQIDLDTLDHLHEIAQTYSIVTPYSSMLVLVNERQEQRLEELEGEADRFQREGEATTADAAFNSFQVTGVPEPHEWLLLTIGALLLGWYILKRRSAG